MKKRMIIEQYTRVHGNNRVQERADEEANRRKARFIACIAVWLITVALFTVSILT